MGKPKSPKNQANKKRPGMKKSKSLPNIGDQKTPRKMAEFMKMKEDQQQKISVPAPSPCKLQTIAEEASPSNTQQNVFRQQFGETFDQYNRRLDEEVRMQLQQTKAMPDLEPEWEEKKEAKKARTREKRKARDAKKKEKKMRRKSDMLFKKKEEELFTDKVNFGDVVLKPPELKVKPRGFEKAPTKKSYNFMKMFSMDGNKFVHVPKKKKTPSSQPDL